MPTPKVNSWLGWRIFTVNNRRRFRLTFSVADEASLRRPSGFVAGSRRGHPERRPGGPERRRGHPERRPGGLSSGPRCGHPDRRWFRLTFSVADEAALRRPGGLSADPICPMRYWHLERGSNKIFRTLNVCFRSSISFFYFLSRSSISYHPD
jgi:hypothetical protein